MKKLLLFISLLTLLSCSKNDLNNIENNQTIQTLSSNGFSTEISSLPNFPSLNNTDVLLVL